jgi:hypothetical protein
VKYNNEFEDVKFMFSLLREEEEGEVQQPEGESFTLTKENDFFQEQSSRIRDLSKGTMINFNPISVDYSLNNFEWSLKMNGNLELILKVSNDDSGMFMTSDNLKMDEATVKALAKLHGYFQQELLTNVTEKLSNKDF